MASSLVLVSAKQDTTSPGEGVLCLGTFIYFVEKTGAVCRPGQDPDFQSRIAGFARRFDEYIIRNSGGDAKVLAEFKQSQGLDSMDEAYICEGDVTFSYDHFKTSDQTKLAETIDDLLAIDGPPTFGDCV